jgi:hypothetical protein
VLVGKPFVPVWKGHRVVKAPLQQVVPCLSFSRLCQCPEVLTISWAEAVSVDCWVLAFLVHLAARHLMLLWHNSCQLSAHQQQQWVQALAVMTVLQDLADWDPAQFCLPAAAEPCWDIDARTIAHTAFLHVLLAVAHAPSRHRLAACPRVGRACTILNRLCCLQLQDAVVCHRLQPPAAVVCQGAVSVHARCQHRGLSFTSVQTAVLGLGS